jgi:hypothetical protein
LYQLGFARPDLAVLRTGSSSVAPVPTSLLRELRQRRLDESKCENDHPGQKTSENIATPHDASPRRIDDPNAKSSPKEGY